MSAASGLERIAWARRTMPVSKSALEALPIKNACNIGIALPLDPAQASLALWLVEAGFTVSILAHEHHEPCSDLLAAMDQAGAVTCATRDAFAGQAIDILLGFGADCLQQVARQLKGVIILGEDVAESAQLLSIPVIHLGASDLIRTCVFENGIGQTCVSGFLDITNLQIAGRGVVVLGYDTIGQGVAKMASAYGAHVNVVENCPVKGLQAKLAGYELASFEEALPNAEVIFAASTPLSSISFADLERLPDGAFLCSASPISLSCTLAEDLAQTTSRKVRDHVTQLTLPSGKNVKLVCEGRPLHLETGKGLPLEYADICVAAQLHSIALLCDEKVPLNNVVQSLSKQIEMKFASALLDQE